ncbi:ribonuclease HII [Alkaliphilus oremlandii]|uniref:Ribonuclease HII n=1 Tax=Alkaliphilus oremlandii (strain OhILAs) TaxID=350688 RepID=RNH2_ALKOO|nr:ribonuclease HII [Alkaliphilus oremlandii]A8MHC7.1 RecName: Full=Ribonuclease HII; Short=RNase HII [Alkaliphilus oremlandii OhILAs]ABW19014.1 Ribonuclease H [Alkaliphilus oremlandii OhILAs]
MPTIDIESAIWNSGYENIACCDEVGRGCLFGSVLAAAVIMPKDVIIDGVKDSKKLSHKKREQLYEIIKEKSLAIGVGTVSSEIIDKINIKNATRLAMKKAILSLKDKDGNIVAPDYILIDAEEIDVPTPQSAVIKGDDLCHGIAAASIVAKVLRDRLCQRWEEEHPNYGIGQNKGYGTKAHREALKEHGPSPMHRKSFLNKIL